ncbi:beta-defensin 105A [Aotus nancymaae]|uniref:Beta-defensin n=1 Tax=Aotus nancymaae TaxID=37293 RepID=A0A2K5DGB0_AOTNA|nr:beta-defensin 105A [Aotus nancymaae]
MVLIRKMFYFVFAVFFILAQRPSGSQAGLDFSQPFSSGEFAVCESCKLGRGKCRKECLESEKAVGSCRLNFLCCRRRI